MLKRQPRRGKKKLVMGIARGFRIARGVFEVHCLEVCMTWDHGKKHTTFQLIINDAKA